jgi:catechol 2,3-dioxygenase-like lactoylglutathione lyase family enzyme
MTDPSDGTMNAWFTDPDGNVWSLFEDPSEPKPDSLGPMLAAADLERAKRWYAETLGLTPEREFEGFVMVYETGGQGFSIYATQYAGTAKNTVAVWEVPNLDAKMADLRSRGVVFEEYNEPGLKTENGIAVLEDGARAAWFRDVDGNILALAEATGR